MTLVRVNIILKPDPSDRPIWSSQISLSDYSAQMFIGAFRRVGNYKERMAAPDSKAPQATTPTIIATQTL